MKHKLDPKDSYIRFEVMDRTHSVTVLLRALLADHSGMENGNCKVLYDKAEEALMDLYQEAGKFVFENHLK